MTTRPTSERPSTYWRPLALACLLLAGVLLVSQRERLIRVAETSRRSVPVLVVLPMSVVDAERELGTTPWIQWRGWCPPELRDRRIPPPTSESDPPQPCYLGPIGWVEQHSFFQTGPGSGGGHVEVWTSLRGAPIDCSLNHYSGWSRSGYSHSASRFAYRVSSDRSIAEYRCDPIAAEGYQTSPAQSAAVRVRWSLADHPEPSTESLPAAVLPSPPSAPFRWPIVASLALLLGAALSAILLRSALSRELRRPWLQATRLTDDRARLADGRTVALLGVPWQGFSLCVIVAEAVGDPYREGAVVRAEAVRQGSLHRLHEALLASERRRWGTTAILSLGSALMAGWPLLR